MSLSEPGSVRDPRLGDLDRVDPVGTSGRTPTARGRMRQHREQHSTSALQFTAHAAESIDALVAQWHREDDHVDVVAQLEGRGEIEHWATVDQHHVRMLARRLEHRHHGFATDDPSVGLGPDTDSAHTGLGRRHRHGLQGAPAPTTFREQGIAKLDRIPSGVPYTTVSELKGDEATTSPAAKAA